MVTGRIRALVRNSADTLCERAERHPEYGFLDTKFDIVSGRDFGAGDPEYTGKKFVYGWIQGRGLESLAGHAAYFERLGDTARARRCDAVLARVLARNEAQRHANGGRMDFALSPEGARLFPREAENVHFSDLFYSKGLFAAGCRLGDPEVRAAGETYFRAVIEGIARNEFRTDQHGFDPKNPVAFVAGKYPQGPRMIALGGLALFMRACPEEPFWRESASSFIRFIFARHMLNGTGDFAEALDGAGAPWREGDGSILCDPGHALEFVGLAAKCLLAMKQSHCEPELFEEAGARLPRLFRHIFDLGYAPEPRGIVKSWNLTRGVPENSDMPWWNLPETVRAGAELCVLWPENSPGIRERVATALSAFFDCFVQANDFACQTRNAAGEIARVIPAVPDADPGYHTNLSLIDALELIPGEDFPA